MPKVELDGPPVIDAGESETITVAVSLDDMQAGDMKNPKTHPIAIALRRRRGVDDARVSKVKGAGTCGSDTTETLAKQFQQ